MAARFRDLFIVYRACGGWCIHSSNLSGLQASILPRRPNMMHRNLVVNGRYIGKKTSHSETSFSPHWNEFLRSSGASWGLDCVFTRRIDRGDKAYV